MSKIDIGPENTSAPENKFQELREDSVKEFEHSLRVESSVKNHVLKNF